MEKYVVQIPTMEIVDWGYSPNVLQPTEFSFDDLPSAIECARKYIITPDEYIYGTIYIFKREANFEEKTITNKEIYSINVDRERDQVHFLTKEIQKQYDERLTQLKTIIAKAYNSEIDYSIISQLSNYSEDLLNLHLKVKSAKEHDEKLQKTKWW